MNFDLRNLWKPKPNHLPKYFAILPYINLVREPTFINEVVDGEQYHLYIGWLNYCLQIKLGNHE